MPRYKVHLSPEIEIVIEIEAESIDDAERNWDARGGLAQAKLAIAEEVNSLDAYEFNVNDVEDLEGEE